MIEPIQTNHPQILAYKLSGKLRHTDYETFAPAIGAAIAAAGGKVQLLIQLENFEGWEASAAWDDTKLGLKHYTAFTRVALVGEKEWEEWMARIWSLLSPAKVKFFNVKDIDAAWEWVAEDV